MIIITIFVVLNAWVVYEFITAPRLDENGNVIKDTYKRIK